MNVGTTTYFYLVPDVKKISFRFKSNRFVNASQSFELLHKADLEIISRFHSIEV